VLATEATALAHGREAAQAAAETARRTFEEGAIDEGLPTFEIALNPFHRYGSTVTQLAKDSGLVSSTSEARRLIQNGGIRVNDVVITDVAHIVKKDDIRDGLIKLSIGRKKHILVKPV
jgi:tyrosyl-tRNA synthetase